MPESKSHFATLKQKSKREPAAPRPSTSRAVKTAWRKSGSKLSLKTWARANPSLSEAWFFNKRANFSKPQQCVGRTRMRVKSGGNKGQQHKDLSGK